MLGCRVKIDLYQLLFSTADVEKAPNHFAGGCGLFGSFFIALPSSVTKKGFCSEQELHMCEMSIFRLKHNIMLIRDSV